MIPATTPSPVKIYDSQRELRMVQLQKLQGLLLHLSQLNDLQKVKAVKQKMEEQGCVIAYYVCMAHCAY